MKNCRATIKTFVFALSLALCSSLEAQRIVNIYNWIGVISPQLIEKFQKETGIYVNYDVYESPEIMEAKMFAARSGYDVVFATAWPYFARQIPAGLYHPLDRSKIKHWSNVGDVFMKKLAQADHGNRFGIPYTWGTTGFGYNKKMIKALGGDLPIDSWQMMFNPDVVKRLSSCGVMLLDSPVDVFPSALVYLGLDPNTDQKDILAKAVEAILRVKPHVFKFHSSRYVSDLANGSICIAQGYSSDILQARNRAQEAGQGVEIEYVNPKEGGSLWMDVMAIPKDAPHLEEAYLFIDFMLRPENAADVTNTMTTANCLPSSKSFVDPDIQSDPAIYPSADVIDNLYVDKAQTPEFGRIFSRAWTKVKTGH